MNNGQTCIPRANMEELHMIHRFSKTIHIWELLLPSSSTQSSFSPCTPPFPCGTSPCPLNHGFGKPNNMKHHQNQRNSKFKSIYFLAYVGKDATEQAFTVLQTRFLLFVFLILSSNLQSTRILTETRMRSQINELTILSSEVSLFHDSAIIFVNSLSLFGWRDLRMECFSAKKKLQPLRLGFGLLGSPPRLLLLRRLRLPFPCSS